MNLRERKKFITGLCNNIRDDLISKAALMPDNWDGHELRVLLADRFAESGRMSVIHNEPRTSRARAYRNFIICSNV